MFSIINMDPSDATVIAALISSITAIIVALIHCYSPIKLKNRQARRKEKKQPRETKIFLIKNLGNNEKCWIMTMVIFVPWIVISPFLYGWLIGLLNIFILIPIVTIVLDILKPIKLVTTVFSVFALHSFNLYITEFAYQSEIGLIELVSDASKAYYSSLIIRGFLPYFLIFIFGNILIIYAVRRYRIRKF